MKALFVSVMLGSVLMTGAAVHGQSLPESVVPIKALMTAKEIEVTGLRTLGPAQVEALSVWLDEYRNAVISFALETAAEGSALEDQVIESRIDGDFDGWVGDTVFKLQNGQIWQQTSPSAKYLFANSPKVVITGTPHRMQVEGLAGEISVRRLK